MNENSDQDVSVDDTVTYYAVIHGETGWESFSPWPRAPRVSRMVFQYQGRQLDEAGMKADFESRFMPLSVEKVDADGVRTLGEDNLTSLAEATALGHAMLNSERREWIFISTRDGRVIKVLPSGIRKAPMPFIVAAQWCDSGAMISRPSWVPPMHLVGRHSRIPGAFLARKDDGSFEPYVPSEVDRVASDWAGLGPADSS